MTTVPATLMRLNSFCKRVVAVLDLVVTVAIGVPLALVASAIIAVPRIRRPRKIRGSRRVVCLNPMRWEWVEQKGILSHVLLLNANGYWDRFYLIHGNTLADRHVVVNEQIEVFEYTRSRYPRLAARGFRFLDLLLSEMAFLYRVVLLIYRQRISVVRSQEPYVNGLRGLLLSRLCGRFFVEDLRANYDLIYRETGRLAYPYLHFRWIEKMLARIVLSRADMVFGGNEDNKQFGLTNGARRRVTFTVRPNGVDPQHFTPPTERRNLKSELGIAGHRLLVWVGRLSPEKYPSDVVRLAARLAATHPDVVATLVGDGLQRQEIEALIQDLGVTSRVMLLGFEPQARIRDLLYSADVLVVTMGGSALIESALSGTPIVAYDAEWHRELIRDGETGLLVPFRDITALAEAAERILNDTALGIRLGETARRRALSQHHPASVAEAEEKCFEWLFEGRTETASRVASA